MSSAPMLFHWTGEAMVPASAFWARKADQEYVVGENYKLVEHHDRSANSHRHYFASIADAHGCELNPSFADLARRRLEGDGLFSNVTLEAA